MSFPVDQACKNSESANDFSEDYAFHLQQGSMEFFARLNEIGAPFNLNGIDIANRARFTGSCIGCHIESSFLDLGNGLVAPPREDFVHVNEFILEPCGNGGTCFGVSSALSSVFLPHRQRVSQALIEGGICGSTPPDPVDPPDQPGTGGGANPGAPPIGIGGGMAEMPPAPSDGSEVVYTLGGQLADDHAH
jgi:hypothetical protein